MNKWNYPLVQEALAVTGLVPMVVNNERCQYAFADYIHTCPILHARQHRESRKLAAIGNGGIGNQNP